MNLVGPSTDRHRPWEPRTLASTTAANELVELAFEEQLQARRRRNGVTGKASRTARHERRTVEALVLDTLAHHLTDRKERTLTIHLGTDWLRGSGARPDAVNTGVRERLIDLVASGWLLLTKGNNHGKGRLTTLQAGPRLLWAAEHKQVGLHDIGRELAATTEIILRGSKGRTNDVLSPETRERIRFEENANTRALRGSVAALNSLFAGASLSQHSCDALPIDLGRRTVHRTFLDARFDRGGRLGGSAFWLNLKKERRRRDLVIDGEPIAEVDLVAALPAIAYGIEGRTMWDDPYLPEELGPVSRGPLKLAFVTFLWSEFRAKTGHFPAEVYGGLPRGVTYAQVHAAFCRHNAPIAHFLGPQEPRGPELMWHESEIIIDATLRCFRRGFSALPIHDALIVPASKVEAAFEALSDAFIARLRVSPMVTHETFGREISYA